LKNHHNPDQARAPPTQQTVGRLACSSEAMPASSTTILERSLLTFSSFQPLSNAERKMFVCEICKTVVPAGISAQKVTLETREVRYLHREKVHPPAIEIDNKKKLKSRRSRKLTPKELEKWSDDSGGHGLEIVREGLACPSCASRLELKSV
jgi:hypothetical protein